MIDESGNTNKETAFILFSCLAETSTETTQTSGFLGNTDIQRQKIEKVIFQDNLEGMNDTRWDVTQLQDNSIWGWYTTTSRGTYVVYIGSYIIVNGNVNSSYLFANIGRDANCITTGDTADNPLIENLELLHVDSVTDMSHMFDGAGYRAMETLDLGNNFDTGSVTNMSGMFANCGYTAMTSIDFGEQFNTNSVTDMSNMFNGCGNSQLTSLTLPDSFNTAKVQDMSGMFQNFGQSKLTTLDLGNSFYTTSATDMSNMFNGCGQTSIVTLDLGPNFTKIANTNTNFANNCGNSGTTIYVAESIYKDMKNFKLDTNSTTQVSLNNTQATINPIYKPEWTKVSSNLDKTTGEMKVVVNGSANKVGTPVTQINYTSDVKSVLTSNDITVYIDGEKADTITKQVSTVTENTNATTGKTEVQYTITLSGFEEALRQAGKNFKEWSGNVSLQFAKGTLKDMYGTEFNGDGNLVNIEGNSNLAEIDIDTAGTIENIVVEETSHLNANTTTAEAKMFTDLIKPEFTYEYANTEIDYTGKTVTIVFDVTDKYFASTDLATDTNAELITVKVDGDGAVNNAITKTLTKLNDLYYTVNGNETHKVGERYQLVISGLQQEPNEGFDYSGIVTLGFGAGIIEDLSGNQNSGTTITIGTDETDGNPNTDIDENGVVVDVVDPVWKVQNLTTTTTDGITTATMDLIATDKFFKQTTLTKDQIQVMVAGVNIAENDADGNPIAPELETSLSSPEYIKWDPETQSYVSATQAEANGQKYTYTVTHLEESYEEFIANREEYAEDPSKGRVYREYSGPITIVIPKETIEDNSGNKNVDFTIDLGDIDTLNPEVVKVDSYKEIDDTNIENSKEIIVFDIVDKYLDSSAISMEDTSKIHVYVDGVETTDVTKTMRSITDFTATIGGVTRTVGHRYTLELSNFKQPRTSISDNVGDTTGTYGDYTELSGTVSIKIEAGTATDTNTPTPNANAETEIVGDYVDFIKPDVTYKYWGTTRDTNAPANPDIDYTNKTFKMVFDLTDKYFDTTTLTAGMTREQLAQYLTIRLDGTDITTNPDIDIQIESVQDVKAKGTVNKTIDEIVGSGETQGKTIDQIVETVNDPVIGKRITLVFSNLEQASIASGNDTLDYSGVISVVIKDGTVTDKTGNTNNAGTTTLVSGVDNPGGTTPDDEVVVDVVDPLWEKVSSSASAINPADKTSSIATITVKATDKYYLTSNLTSDLIKVLVDGVDVTEQVTVDVSEVTPVNGLAGTQIGDEYTITVTGFAQNANQVKIQIQPGAMTDESGNTNKVTDLIVYNTLKNATEETEATSVFLGGPTTIQRQNIEQVIFVSNLDTINTAVAWDVSEMQDKSIMAWYAEGDTAPYTIYIGSNDEIFANQNSGYLFSYIGYASNCTATETITNIEELNISSVTKMNNMFQYVGYNAMTSLDLGTNFDTSNVTDMSAMFDRAGYNKMATLNLGDKFNTAQVTNMEGMFRFCGYSELTALNLGNHFYTSKGVEMGGMFQALGVMKLTSLDLGQNFDTSNAINMNWMFDGTGAMSMTSLTLGDKFNTSKVLYMEGMFRLCGAASLTSLDLGDLFYTTSATNMNDMFNGCGQLEMTSLDLGPAFTKIADAHEDFIPDCGKSGAIIYAPESIYNDMKNFKTSTDSTTTIEYTKGTINPIYKTEWTKVSSTIDEENQTISIVIKGNAIVTQTVSEVDINYDSNVTSTLTGDLINIYIDGELDEEQNITRTVVKDTENSTDKEIYYTITLSNFEEALRQSGKNFKEWSGNISIQPLKGTLKDVYGNGNMQEIDYTEGNWTKVELKDTATNKNTDGTMFTDYIKPEFTYEYSNTVIDYDMKTVTVVFDVTDKYFNQTTVSADNITIQVDGTEPDWTKATKTLTKKTSSADQTVDGVTYKANGDIYYTVNGTSTKIGERYELVVSGLETENGVGYSGSMTMAFPAGLITDQSNNSSLAKTITVGIDDPENHEDHNEAVTVDVVNPLWTGPHNVNSIDRTAETVSIKILGSDKYYASNSLTPANIKVFVDDVEVTTVTKNLEEITDSAELQTLVESADLGNAKLEDIAVGYTLTLGDFADISGVTKIVIQAGTITDTSGNTNIETTIPVGNINWKEENEPLEETDADYPRYSAFRQDIVDFIKPKIKYQYSAVEGTENPDIDYEAKTLTVKFTVTDKYLVESSIMNEDGTLNTDNVRIVVAGTDITDDLITTITSQPIADGYEYTLVVSNFELVYNSEGYQDYSGIVQLVFEEGQIDDTSGNKNAATTLTIDTDDGDDPDSGIIVDVIDPLIEKTEDNLSVVNANNGINRDLTNETGTVSVRIKATDKYLGTTTLQNADNIAKIKVKVVKPNGETVYPDTIMKQVSQVSKTATEVIYQITLSNFEDNQGITSIVIPEGVITDKSGNGNEETELLVGNATWTEIGDINGEYTAFRESIVDFTRPTYEYSTSSITRDRDGETGTVTIKILGRDDYFLKDTLTENNINVYVDNSENPETPITTITKTLTKITDEAELNGADVGYELTLGNFGTYDGAVKIEIAENTIIDTSGIGNKTTQIPVGNPNWVETDIGDNEDNPKYTAFRNDIVDFIKPTITYKYAEGTNPVIDQENKQVSIIFDAVDTNFLESDILTVDDIKQILVDDMDVTNTLTKQLTSENIPEGEGNGIRYTLTLSNFELDENLENEIFRRHSGKIEFVIAENKVRDTSGNANIETRIVVDNDDGDDENNYITVDFINPKLYYKDKFISYAERYATVTISGTDRFYDFNTTLEPEDISIYELNRDGEYIQRTDLPITITPVRTEYGYDFVVRIDEFEEEFKQLKISIPAGKISDTQGHSNEATDIYVDLDNKKPVWKYISTDTSEFESNGKISFTVKGQDTFLVQENSNLTAENIRIIKDGEDITNTGNITVQPVGEDSTEISESYQIDITGLTEIGTYSLVIEKETLVDEFNNLSNATTISFSKSVIGDNTDNYTMVTYHVTPDFEQMHQTYVHELMRINTTGTNEGSSTYRASSLGEIYGNGDNNLFAEPFTYKNGVQTAYSFAGWAVANENGYEQEPATIYDLYTDIPSTVTNLRAVWQEATVIFVSKDGANTNDGLSPTTPVQDLTTAYSKLNTSGNASNNIIVIMDAIEWNSSERLSGNATITSLYAGVDYRTSGAELKISSNMDVEGDITFDNIKLYSDSTSVSDGSDYLATSDYLNILVTNYGDITLGRGISTPEDKYTFGGIVGGNYKEEETKGTIGNHRVIVEAGRYNNIIAGSSLDFGNQTTNIKYVSHEVIIGTMKESVIARNEQLVITGYLAIGELEDRCYPYNSEGAQDTTLSYNRTYANTEILSGTFTGENKFHKASEDAVMYLRSINGYNDGKSQLDIYGGNITGNIYGGSRMPTTKDSNSDEQPDVNILNFYSGQINGNIFGHGGNDTSTGNSRINLQGATQINGNIYGGSNTTTVPEGKVTGKYIYCY